MTRRAENLTGLPLFLWYLVTERTSFAPGIKRHARPWQLQCHSKLYNDLRDTGPVTLRRKWINLNRNTVILTLPHGGGNRKGGCPGRTLLKGDLQILKKNFKR